MTVTYRLVDVSEYRSAAQIHRSAGSLIPGYNPNLHDEAEFETFYLEKVMVDCVLWGAYARHNLVGFVALLPGWIDHLYVGPAFHNRGIGGELVKLAQREQSELRLYTFQANLNARRLYEKNGFVVEELTDGQRNEEKMPDVTYHWTQSA
jgi:ribosomal protein S18 acetylase RimI-like enzyme